MEARSAGPSKAPPCCCFIRPEPSRPAAARAPGLLHGRRQDDHHRLQGGRRHKPRLGAQSAAPTPGAHIEVGADAYDVTSRELPRAERDELFDKVVAAAPGFGEYQSKTSRIIPLFELTS